jgi:O-antigen ligase/polysaccharide polymerase Wzy-like membrane protein
MTSGSAPYADLPSGRWAPPDAGRDRLRRLGALGAVALAAVVGMLVPISPVAAAAPIALIVGVVAVNRVGLFAPALLLFALVPWLIVLDAMIPPLLRTIVTAAATAALLVVAMPLQFRSRIVPIGSAIFLTMVLAHGAVAEGGEALTQMAKWTIFPMLAVAVVSERGRELLPQARTVLLGSCLAALLVHLAFIGAGMGGGDAKYGIGERLGFGGSIPHELALFGVVVAGAGLVATKRFAYQIAFFGIGAVPAILTGVRSALLAACVIMLIFLVQSGIRPRTIGVVAGIIIVAFVSGAVDTVTARFNREAELGTPTGSGRLEIWSTAFRNWEEAGPPAWVLGTGFDSIRKFELKDIGIAYVGHSDVAEILVQLGLIAFVAWMLIWLGLLRSGLRGMVLVPILVYAVVNGSIEYVGPLAMGLVLAAACVEPPDEEAASARAGP